jgi:hypothetical protein
MPSFLLLLAARLLAGDPFATMPPRPPGLTCEPSEPGAAALVASRRAYLGVWQPEGSTARFRICIGRDVPIVTGIDSNDGEVFRIQDASFDGNRLLFTSVMPSNSFTVHQEWRAQGETLLDFTHESTGQVLRRVAP